MNEILKERIEKVSDHFAHLYPRVSVADVITFRRDAFQAGGGIRLAEPVDKRRGGIACPVGRSSCC